jgi:hypothetical protein
MSQNLGHVLRKNQVKITGSCRLDLDAAHSQQPAAVAKSRPAAASAHVPQVRIVENGLQGVVLECICACGSKTYIQCDYVSAV